MAKYVFKLNLCGEISPNLVTLVRRQRLCEIVQTKHPVPQEKLRALL